LTLAREPVLFLSPALRHSHPQNRVEPRQLSRVFSNERLIPHDAAENRHQSLLPKTREVLAIVPGEVEVSTTSYVIVAPEAAASTEEWLESLSVRRPDEKLQ
jgi:hypothetical protein